MTRLYVQFSEGLYHASILEDSDRVAGGVCVNVSEEWLDSLIVCSRYNRKGFQTLLRKAYEAGWNIEAIGWFNEAMGYPEEASDAKECWLELDERSWYNLQLAWDSQSTFFLTTI